MKMGRTYFTVILMVVASLFAVCARADTLIDGAKTCTQYFPTEEKQHRIPLHLLAAIASAESGRWHQALNMPLPWPWTINAAGKGYYFDSKAEAIAKTRELQAKGVKSIDVGCMQVNLKHHANAFRDLNDAFDPKQNVAYAAKFLRSNYDGLGDWVKATSAYHSRTKTLGSKYLNRIKVTWNRIVERVRSAHVRLGSAEGYQAPRNPLGSGAHVVRPAGETAIGGIGQNRLPGSSNVKVLQVSEANATSAGTSLGAINQQKRPGESIIVVKSKTAGSPPNAPSIAALSPAAGGTVPAALDKKGKSSQTSSNKNKTGFVFAY